MAQYVNLVIDGQEFTPEKGTPLMKVFMDCEITVPSLCYHPILKSHSRCGLCIIEVKVNEAWVINYACEMVAEEGLKISTNSLNIHSLRSSTAAQLLKRGPFENTKTTEFLQQLITKTEKSNEADYFSDHSLPMKGCILCGRCINVCNMIGKHYLTFLGRGPSLRISFVKDKLNEFACIKCKACRNTCPTGYIAENGKETFTNRLYRD